MTSESASEARELNVRICLECFPKDDPEAAELALLRALRSPLNPENSVDLFYDQAPVMRYHQAPSGERLGHMWRAVVMTLPEDMYQSFLQTQGVMKGRQAIRPEWRQREE